jgi:hypothetical protein
MNNSANTGLWQPIDTVPMNTPIVLKKRESDGELLAVFTRISNNVLRLTTGKGSWDGSEVLYKHLYGNWMPRNI